MTGHDHDVTARFGRQVAHAREPVRHPRCAGVVGGGGQTEVSEALPQTGQQLRGLGNRGHRVIRVGQPALGRRTRHELGNAPRADGA